MSRSGETVRLDGVRTKKLVEWTAGDPHVWTYRRITVEQIIDTRYVITLHGRSPVGGLPRGYDEKSDAWRVVQQLMTTPDEAGNHYPWERK